METKQIVNEILTDVLNRKEIFNVAIDRGEGEGMQIEKWVLVEMNANLIKLKANGILDLVEGEHKYHEKKTAKGKLSRNFEHCDLWWKIDNSEHWLEVKTIVLAKNAQKGSLKDISKDLKKIDRIREKDIFHHLSIIFPVECEKVDDWKKEISKVYYENDLKLEQDWKFSMGGNKSIVLLLFTNYV